MKRVQITIFADIQNFDFTSLEDVETGVGGMIDNPALQVLSIKAEVVPSKENCSEGKVCKSCEQCH